MTPTGRRPARAAHRTGPGVARMLWRGLTRRCPRCGSGRVFATWFRMVEHCPGCRLRFERENDFFLGAYVINLAVTEGLLAVALLAYVFRLAADPAGDPAADKVPVMVGAAVLAVAGPVLFFPFSRTIWAAIDLAMRPVPPDADADADADADDDGARPSP